MYSARVIDDQDDLDSQEVERRGELRATFPGLRIRLLAPRAATFEAVEASRRSFFVRAGDPEAFRLGEISDSAIEHGERAAACRLEVIRKELHPRCGVALRIASIDARNEQVLAAILNI